MRTAGVIRVGRPLVALGLLFGVAAPVEAVAAAPAPAFTFSVGIGDPCFHGTGPASAIDPASADLARGYRARQ